MCKRRLTISLLVLILVPIFLGCASAERGAVSPGAGRGVVVSPHPVASDIGLRVLDNGGNAVDAAVAIGLALGVVDQFNSGLGGGGFIVIRMADGRVYTIDGRETAPATATRDMYIRDGAFDPSLSQVGPLAVGVPGLLAAYARALELAGSQTLADLIAPSIRMAEQGFELDAHYISRYAEAADVLKSDPASARIYFRSDGSPLEPGDVLRQADLAETYRKIAKGGTDYFYRGEFAERLAEYMNETGGLITVADMASYIPKERMPVIGTYRNYEIIGMGPPSSGGVHIIQILNMLEASGILRDRTDWDAATVNGAALFMRKAFEDRAAYLGDMDFYPVPVKRLTSKRYAAESVRAIMREPAHGSASSTEADVFSGHTTNLCVIDKWGNAATINQTVNLTYGAKCTLPGTGVILNNEMDDFSAQPGVPNAFGLIGSEANSIAPGKRPLSSMSPTIVTRNGKPILIIGGAGGPTIITAVLQIIVDMVDFGKELAVAQSLPRFHHQFRPDAIVIEESFPTSIREELVSGGQSVISREELGRVNAIAWSDEKQAYVAVADPRGRNQTAIEDTIACLNGSIY